jgi:hypothetical protein
MDITEGIRTLRGRSVEIPDCGRNDITKLMKDNGMRTIAEIGVYKGEYTEVLAKSGLTVYAIDPWDEAVEYPYYNGKSNPQVVEDENYAITKNRVAPYQNVELIKRTSMDALELFEDESLDAVYIDGNHSFKYVAEDIASWIKKVKKGGFVCGHDYFYGNKENFHVRYVVDAFVAAHGIENLWILGRKDKREGETRDKWRSWVFQRQ